MAGCGALNPCPMRLGGGRGRIGPLLDSLNAQAGSATDTSEGAVVYAENLATARILAGMWSTNQRFANQFDRRKTTCMLSRWERILDARPRVFDTPPARRARIAKLEGIEGRAVTRGFVEERLIDELGSFFYALESIPLSVAAIHVPDASYPWGTVQDGAPWLSTVAHLLVRMVKPPTATEAEFYDAAGRAVEVLDPLLPSWITVDWYRAPANGGVSVPGGYSAAGIWLDEDKNLDNHIFDV